MSDEGGPGVLEDPDKDGYESKGNDVDAEEIMLDDERCQNGKDDDHGVEHQDVPGLFKIISSK
jgi:hypothetical protein